MKRNKRTVVMAHAELAPLTEHILATMGQEGTLIRQRLKSFYQERGGEGGPRLEQPVETASFEMA